MWHEARKQEKKIRGMLVDYRKRADRRKEFYEKIRTDPNQFLQVHGRKCKIHYEVTDMTDDMHMMPWQGQKDNLIDRFDVRAHLDYIPPVKKEETQEEKISEQDRQVNYESYRVLAQNEFLGLNETEFLRQIQIEEQYGSGEKAGGDSDKKKKSSSLANAAIGYTYEDSATSSTSAVPFSQQILSIETSTVSTNRYEEFAKGYSDEDEDMDVTVDIKKIGTTQAHELNNYGKKYGMTSNDLFSYLTRDEEEKQSMKAMKEQEADKMLGGGRKSRRERRSQREKRILGKPFTLSPPSYAAKQEKLTENEDDESDKSSNSRESPSVEEKITFITSFGGEDELQPHSKISIPFKKTLPKTLVNLRRNETFADKVRENSEKLKIINESEKKRHESSRRSRSRSSSRHRYSSPRRRERYRSSSYSSRERAKRRRYSRSSSRHRYSSPRRRDRYRSSSYSSRERIKRKRYSRSKSRDRYSSSRRRERYKSSSYSSRERAKRKRYSSSSSYTSTTSSSSSSHRSSLSSPEKREYKEKSLSKEKSKSPSREKKTSLSPKASPEVQPPPPTVVKRYYGRKKDNESSSSLSIDSDDDDDDDRKETGSNESSANDVQKIRSADIKIGFSKSCVGPPTSSNPREKLKKKMQILLNKQYKKDKKAETEKIERQMQQQQERDEEMRELAIKLRRRQRELRHKYGDDNKDSRTNSDSDEKESKGKISRKSSSSSTSSSDDNERYSSPRKHDRYKSSNYSSRLKTSISRSPVRYRRSRSKSSGRNYRRYSRSRSRDYRR